MHVNLNVRMYVHLHVGMYVRGIRFAMSLQANSPRPASLWKGLSETLILCAPVTLAGTQSCVLVPSAGRSAGRSYE